MKRYISIYILLCFIVTSTMGPCPLYAQGLILPQPGQMVALSPAYSPILLKGLKLDPNDPFHFEFFVDKGKVSTLKPTRGHDFSRVPKPLAKQGSIEGESDPEEQTNAVDLKKESTKLIKYFLTSLTIPEKDLWVNLSPYEKDHIIPQAFGQTEMGRDLLVEDYFLKQITSSLIYPESKLGKEFWNKVYAQAQAKYGTTNIPINTFNKVWIVPDKAVVYENKGTAFVLESHLKVMLEEDYLSLQKHQILIPGRQPGDMTSVVSPSRLPTYQGLQSEASQGNNRMHNEASDIIRDLIIPALTKEVNEGKNFAPLRQVFYSLILATWYKKKIKESILNKIYSNQNKIQNLVIPVKAGIHNKNNIEFIYQQYLKAFKKGVYNYIKEEPMSSPNALVGDLNNKIIPRKYFSGGFSGANLPITSESRAQITPIQITRLHRTSFWELDTNAAMNSTYGWGARTIDDLVQAKRTRMSEIEKEHGGIPPYPSTIALIKELAQRKVILGVGSSNIRATRILKELGVFDDFKAVIDGNTSGIPAKPDPGFFLAVAQRLGLDPRRSVVFEDAVTGVRSAKGGGFGLVIGLARENDTQQLRDAGADIVVEDIRELNTEIRDRLFSSQGIIFDMDGVIANSVALDFQAWKEVFENYLKFRETEFQEPFQEYTREEFSAYASGKKSPDIVRSFLEFRRIDMEDKSFKPSSPAMHATIAQDGIIVKRIYQDTLENKLTGGQGAWDLMNVYHKAFPGQIINYEYERYYNFKPFNSGDVFISDDGYDLHNTKLPENIDFETLEHVFTCRDGSRIFVQLNFDLTLVNGAEWDYHNLLQVFDTLRTFSNPKDADRFETFMKIWEMYKSPVQWGFEERENKEVALLIKNRVIIKKKGGDVELAPITRDIFESLERFGWKPPEPESEQESWRGEEVHHLIDTDNFEMPEVYRFSFAEIYKRNDEEKLRNLAAFLIQAQSEGRITNVEIPEPFISIIGKFFNILRAKRDEYKFLTIDGLSRLEQNGVETTVIGKEESDEARIHFFFISKERKLAFIVNPAMSSPAEKSSHAMNAQSAQSKTGGIDLNPAQLSMELRKQGGRF